MLSTSVAYFPLPLLGHFQFLQLLELTHYSQLAPSQDPQPQDRKVEGVENRFKDF